MSDRLEDRVAATSGMEATLGYRRTVFEEGRAVVELDLDDRHLNINRIVHGGMYAVMIDDAIGYVACWTGDEATRRQGATLNLSVEFLAAPEGRRLIATAWRKGGGKSIFFGAAEVRDETGRLCATGAATYRIFAPRG